MNILYHSEFCKFRVGLGVCKMKVTINLPIAPVTDFFHPS